VVKQDVRVRVANPLFPMKFVNFLTSVAYIAPFGGSTSK